MEYEAPQIEAREPVTEPLIGRQKSSIIKEN